MLLELHISNYALIDELNIQFYKGFNIITGETGAGKSIVLGALGLVMGQRADLNVLQDKERKCTVESIFNIKDYRLQDFFEREELDYDDQTILRREISPAGKSRAFINDTPVNLKVMQDLALRLIDIHSQHQNLELGNQSFQLNLVDLVADNKTLLVEYAKSFRASQKQAKVLRDLQEEAEKAKADLDYFQFQFQQLDEAKLKENEQQDLEAEQSTLEHAEDIKMTFGQFAEDLDGEELGLLVKLKDNVSQFSKLGGVVPKAKEVAERLESCYLELKDLVADCSDVAERTEHDPDRIQLVSERLDLLYNLQQKFRVGSVEELLALKEDYDQKINQIASFDDEIEAAEQKLVALQEDVNTKAAELSERRQAVAGRITESVEDVLQKLGMPNAVFRLSFETMPQAGPSGTDDLCFTFSANKNGQPQDIAKIASGGEISRVMLALKTLITDSKALPTIIFDEIDTGISGEVALKMGVILKQMASNVQIINITHLPQIAGKGEHHFKVYKYDEADRTYTSIRQLGVDERIDELAQMLSGSNASETARKTARELLE
ncbi:DNA repair protein RecN [Mangrovibacterium diazotrophicum]|uniref:DNA repair protein RecN n=1 Tax=Mangrovibacterium diazotrophicum TaxID=1261403 RepID=A0A419W5U2_9BACT|nr:DNA repair protein RecN [Mangrovibacterium diazotrophicum]RKD90817.1 DNA replication and repair protein RecN [Mangrovibacterium diazotrophicum]